MHLLSLVLWVPEDDIRPVTALELFEDENKAEINAKVAQERRTTQENLHLYSKWKSALWKALTAEQQDDYKRRAELMTSEAEAQRAEPLTKEKIIE